VAIDRADDVCLAGDGSVNDRIVVLVFQNDLRSFRRRNNVSEGLEVSKMLGYIFITQAIERACNRGDLSARPTSLKRNGERTRRAPVVQ
jgi:hypothetical protein